MQSEQSKKSLRQWLNGAPRTMLVIVAGLVVLGLVSGPLVDGLSDKDKINNVLLTGVPFILLFVALVLFFIFLILLVSYLLNNRVAPRMHRAVEFTIIGGVVLGVVGMFQPWILGGFQWGFILLFVCFLMFNVWSHINPRRG